MASFSAKRSIGSGEGSAGKLPLLKQTNRLVSPTNSPENKPQWAGVLRQRLDRKIENDEDVGEQDIQMLRSEIAALFIPALQKNDRASWKYLCDVFPLIQPYKHLLTGQYELSHYLERVIQHLELHKERLFDLNVIDAIAKVFPKDVEAIKESGRYPKQNYCPPTAPTKSAGTPRKHNRMLLPDGRNPYALDVPTDPDPFKPPAMTIGELRASIPAVALEMATREAIWSACLASSTLFADLPEMDEPDEDEPLSPISTARTSSHSTPRVATKQKAPAATPRALLSGRDAVQYFTKCLHLGKIKYMYFNLAANRHYKPYDLVEVPRDRIEPEHYVFSTFGVLHIVPDRPNENQSLTDWQKDAVLFRAISAIPFFKQYLELKMFRRWHASVQQQRFRKKRSQVRLGLLTAVPSFGAAMLQVSRLCNDLHRVVLLPHNAEKCYELGEFENAVNYIRLQTEKILERFYRYTRIVMDTTAQEAYRKLQHAADQVNQKSIFSKESLHLKKKKRETREANLKKAREEIERLNDFGRLVEQLLLAHLIQLARRNVLKFVHDTLEPPNPRPDPLTTTPLRDGFFRARLGFGTDDELALSPSCEQFMSSLERAVADITPLLCDSAIHMAGSIIAFNSPILEEEDGDSVQGEIHIASIKDLLKDPKRRRPKEMSGKRTKLSVQKISEDASMTDAKIVATPDIPKATFLSKEEDNLGIKTPELIEVGPGNRVSPEKATLAEQHVDPINAVNLNTKLENDDVFSRAMKVKRSLVDEAKHEVADYCAKNKWLTPIYRFCQEWTPDNLSRHWKGVQAFQIEQKLNEIRQWSEKVRNFDHSYSTDNGLLYIDNSGVHNDLLPKLDAAFTQLCTFVASEAVKRGTKFCDEMAEVIATLKDKQTHIGGFAVYARNVAKYKKSQLHYKERVDYVKSLFEVIRMSYRALLPEEEQLEERIQNRWDSFLVQMQEAHEFVNVQTPLITQNLDESFQKLEAEARELCEEATTGQYLNADNDPTDMLAQLKKIREKFSKVDNELQQASKWKEAITGTPYPLGFLRDMSSRMDIRYELWKYVEISMHQIREWKGMLFKRFNVRKALDKITEWLAAAAQMNPHLPSGDDLLAHWFRMLNDFKQHLPLLHKLSNDALKERHWKLIFLGMGEQYDPDHEFTVEELISYNLPAHASVIMDVFAAAVNEYSIEQSLVKVSKQWQEREFKLAKHIPDSMYKDENPIRQSSPVYNKKMKRFEKFRLEKAPMQHSRVLDLQPDKLFIVIEVIELRHLLQDSRMTVQSMLTSPHLAEKRASAEVWAERLAELEEIMDLWLDAQTLWLSLLKVFEDPEIFKKMGNTSLKFESVHLKLTDVMSALVGDPRVTSVMTHPRSDRQYRLHQGDKLRQLLMSAIQQQEEIFLELESVFERSRQQFPRLYFLSRQDLVELLSVSRNPQALVPFARKCFHGITNLSFALPSNTNTAAINSALDYALNAHKLEVTGVKGVLGEELPLQHRVEATESAAKWLSKLELSLKTTMLTITEAALLARLDPESSKCQPLQLLEELARYECNLPQTYELEEIAADIKGQFQHWLLRFPPQCVVVAEAVMWERAVFRALEKQDREELKNQRSLLLTRMEQYVTVLRDNSQSIQNSDMRQRLHLLVGNLVNQATYHVDIMDRLLSNPNISDGAFDWLTTLKYYMEIRTVLRAKTEAPATSSTVVIDSPDSAVGVDGCPPGSRSETAVPASRHDDLTLGMPPPPPQRSITQVSTGYQLGQCVVSQMGATFSYDQEYMGAGERLVLTPLTERAQLSLTTALKTFQCGALIGPAATGKTETVRDLAKALGRHLVVVNCNDEMLLPQMNQYLSGMIQSGSWALFDDAERMATGVLSVFGQQLDYVSSALKVLDNSSNNQYGIRGQPRFDKKAGEKRIRRNSLTTLHSLPPGHASTSPTLGGATSVIADNMDSVGGGGAGTGGLERQTTVPHGFNEEGLITYFEDPWVKERERRHSIEKEIKIKESQFYKTVRPPPLFYEHVTLHRKPKPDYKDLIRQYVPYKPTHIGNILFNGKLVKANANYGCFMTFNTNNPEYHNLPENLRLAVRPCALIVPDIRVVLETRLYCAGFTNHPILSKKLVGFFEHCKTQLERGYELGLRTVQQVVKAAANKLHNRLSELLVALQKQQRKTRKAASKPYRLPSPGKEAAAANSTRVSTNLRGTGAVSKFSTNVSASAAGRTDYLSAKQTPIGHTISAVNAPEEISSGPRMSSAQKHRIPGHAQSDNAAYDISTRHTEEVDYSMSAQEMSPRSAGAGQGHPGAEQRAPREGVDREDAAAGAEDAADDGLEVPPGVSRTIELPAFERKSLEERCILSALSIVLKPKMATDSDAARLRHLIRDAFPSSARAENENGGEDGAVHPALLQALEEQMKQENLQITQDFINKVVQLYTSLELGQGIILSGQAGSGKTTVYRLLAKVLTRLNLQQTEDSSKLKIEDNFTPERTIQQHKGNKLKDETDDRFLRGVSAMKRSENEEKASARWQKASLVSAIASHMSTNVTEKPLNAPKVDVTVLYPNALSPKELYGNSSDEGGSGVWQRGVLDSVMQHCEKQAIAAASTQAAAKKAQAAAAAHICSWLVLDGELHASWTDSMNTLLDDCRTLSLPNVHTVKMPGSMHVLLEVTDMVTASPATLSRCAVLHCGPTTLSWKQLFESWLATAKQKWVLNTAGLQVLQSLVSSCFATTLKFLQDTAPSPWLNGHVSEGIDEVSSFLALLSSLLDRHMCRETHEHQQQIQQIAGRVATSVGEKEKAGPPRSRLSSLAYLEDSIPHYMANIRGMFAFSYIWGFGGGLQDSVVDSFSDFARKTLASAAQPIKLSSSGGYNGFDFYHDFAKGQLIPWNDKPVEKVRNLPPSYIVTPQIDRYSFLMDLLLTQNYACMLTGEPGVGKSALINNLVSSKHLPSRRLVCSAGIHPMHMCEMIRDVREELTATAAGGSGPLPPSGGTRPTTAARGKETPWSLMFLEDLHASPGVHTMQNNSTGCQQPMVELVRQVLSEQCVYDQQRRVMQPTPRFNFLTAITNPHAQGLGLGRGSHPVSARAARQFVRVCMRTPESKDLLSIFGKTILTWLEEFPTKTVEHHAEFARALVNSSIQMLESVRGSLVPTPAHPHYVFSLHDVGRCLEGVMLLSPRSKLVSRRKKTLANGAAGIDSSANEPLPMMRVIARLWCHEITRVYGDRITTPEDTAWFEKILEKIVVKNLCSSHPSLTNISMNSIDEASPTQLSAPDSPVVHGSRTPSPPPRAMSPRPPTPPKSPRPNTLGTEVARVKSPKPGKPDKAKKPAQLLKRPPSTARSVSPTSTTKGSVSKGSVSTTKGSGGSKDGGGAADDTKSIRSSISSRIGGETTGASTPAETPYMTEDEDEGEEFDDVEEDEDEDEEEETESEDEEDSQSDSGSVTKGGHRTKMLSSSLSRISESPDGRSPRRSTNTGAMSRSTMRSRGSKVVLLPTPAPPPTKTQSNTKNKRAVTFKAGLLADRDVAPYTGPLLSLEHICERGESLTSFVFTKFILGVHAEMKSITADKGYVEVSRSQLEEALYSCLAVYNKQQQQRVDVVFFREAAEHIARLSRVLALPAGHALLLGDSTGRATLVRIAATAAHAKLFEPKIQAGGVDNRRIVREHLKRASRCAALQGRSTVLMLRQRMGAEAMQDVLAFINTGTCPGLYSKEEIGVIASSLTPGGVKVTKPDKLYLAFSKFTNRVKQQLHVVIVADYSAGRSESLKHELDVLPGLFSRLCHIDLYHPWTHQAYVHVATHCLNDPNCKLSVAWSDGHTKAERVSLVANAMAHVHTSSRAALKRLHRHQRANNDYHFFTPLTFMEFSHIYKLVANYIVHEQKARIAKFAAGLAKIEDAWKCVDDFRKQVAELIPGKDKAHAAVLEHINNVENLRAQYMEILEQCRLQEELIEKRMAPLEAMRAETKADFDSVEPTYQAARAALDSLDKHSVEEIRSYRVPPEGIVIVMEALCLLFNREKSWEEGHSLLMMDNIFEELEFYDKNNMPDKTFEELGRYYNHPDCQPDQIRRMSLAALCLCLWIRSIYVYAAVKRKMQPKLRELEQAEEKLAKDQQKLGQMRVEGNRIKSGLEKEIKAHTDAVLRAKQIDQQIRSVERMIAKATSLIDSLDPYTNMWRGEIKQAKAWLRTAAGGDSLLTAAALCYHGPLDSSSRASLMADWIQRCSNVNTENPLEGFMPNSTEKARGLLMASSMMNIKPVTVNQQDGEQQDTTTAGTPVAMHSIQPHDIYPAGEETVIESYDILAASHQDVTRGAGAGAGEVGAGSAPGGLGERTASSASNHQQQLSLYQHRPSLYDTGITFKTEVRVVEKAEDEASPSPVGGVEKRKGGGEAEEAAESASSVSSVQRNLLAVRENFTIQNVLSSFEEMSEWQLAGLPTDIHSIHNALIMRVTAHNRKHCWPLLVDPDGRAELWVHTLQNSDLKGMNEAILERQDELASDGLKGLEGSNSSQPPRPMTQETNYTQHSTAYTYNSTEASTTVPDDPRAQTRTGGIASGMTSANEYRALTSITHSAEAINLMHIDQITELERPENNLWVVEADADDLHCKLIHAVVYGVTVLVTHLERRPMDPLFRGLMLKHFTVNEHGQRVLQVGDTEYPYHPRFALYLSSSVPLFLNGDGIYELPVSDLCVIDMGYSQEAITTALLQEVMAVERPEYEVQHRSIESDIIHHQDSIRQEREKLLKFTTDLSVPLLEEKNLPEAIEECNTNMARGKTMVEEAKYLRELLEDKKTSYKCVAAAGNRLFELCQRVSVLSPMYFMSLHTFVHIMKDTLRACHRGKGITGAPIARAQELTDQFTRAVYVRCIAPMMYEPHSAGLFRLLLSLDRMRADSKLSNAEVGLFVNGVDTSAIEDTMVFHDKPDWITNKMWLDCAALESTMSAAFRHLRDSLTKYTNQWHEYFTHPLELTTPTPDDRLSSLSIFQKCVLWRIMAPHKLSEVSSKLVVYELGGLLPPPLNYNIQTAYEEANKSVPVILMLPPQATDKQTGGSSVLLSPAHQVLQLAKSVSMEGKVHVVTCGGSGHMTEVQHALADSMTQGYWLVLNNAHLAQQAWSNDMLTLIKQIVSSRAEREITESDSSEDDDDDDVTTPRRGATRGTQRTQTHTPRSDPVHKDFRLWVITRSDTKTIIPGMLIQYGLKVTVEQSSNFTDTYLRIYQSAEKIATKRDTSSSTKVYGHDTMQMLLASVLHCVLLQRSQYGALASQPHWSNVDLTAALHQCRTVLALCQRHRGVVDMSSLVYGGHCVDDEDRKCVKALAQAIMLHPKHLGQLINESESVTLSEEQNITELLGGILCSLSSATSLEDRLAQLPTITAPMIGLPNSADDNRVYGNSSALLADLIAVIGAPTTPTPALCWLRAQECAQYLISMTNGLPLIPEEATDSSSPHPLPALWHSEALLWRRLVDQIKTDCREVIEVCTGSISSSPRLDRLMAVLSEGSTVPRVWTKDSFNVDEPVLEWAAGIQNRLIKLQEYLSMEPNTVVCYNMAVFLRPDRFVQSVLQTYARREYKDLHACSLDAQFLQVGVMPESVPDRGCYVNGLMLHHAKWDSVTSTICDLDPTAKRSKVTPTSEPAPAPMPVIWLKPLLTTELDAIRARQGAALYPCPVYGTVRSTGVCSEAGDGTGSHSVIATVELPTVKRSPGYWTMQRVYLTAKLTNEEVG